MFMHTLYTRRLAQYNHENKNKQKSMFVQTLTANKLSQIEGYILQGSTKTDFEILKYEHNLLEVCCRHMAIMAEIYNPFVWLFFLKGGGRPHQILQNCEYMFSCPVNARQPIQKCTSCVRNFRGRQMSRMLKVLHLLRVLQSE